ncbi:response regulator transcription factor [Neobacillus sp. YIM B06451]|uniref:response regulator transcription factor n=1 Tax=Neobacillus sp. YIM B06451 TaxID=3070994 RepID=UPI002930C8FB|nr:response regulator transcription factor [Neobacillus sp. YIM B06451]
MEKESILIVEDEEKIARVLELELEFEGYSVKKAADGIEGLEAYRTGKWDLILLDVMLPGMSGVDLLRRIRANDPVTKVIMLTAKGEVEDKVAGLDLGANDYITKPFQIDELLARIRAALRFKTILPSNEDKNELTFGGLTLNMNTREVNRSGTSINLTPREYDLLVYLLTNRRQVLTRDQILEKVWGYDFAGDTNVVDVYIRYLRKKIDLSGLPPLIHTVRGVGYVLREAQ